MIGHPIPCSCCCQQPAPSKEQIRQCRQHIDLAPILGQAVQPGFLKAELLFDHSEWVLDFRADVGFGCLYQILQSSLGRIRQGSPLAWSHRHSELGPPE